MAGVPLTDALRNEYERLFTTCEIRPQRAQIVEQLSAQLTGNSAGYHAVADVLGIPWFFIAVIHNMEAGQRFTAHLHNGDPLTAEDVKFSFERAARGKRPWVFEKIAGAPAFIKGSAGEITGIRVPDDRTVLIRLDRPFAPFVFLMAYDAASIVPREETERLGATFATHPVGSGAFRLKEWRRDDRVVLDAFVWTGKDAPTLIKRRENLQYFRTHNRRSVDRAFFHSIFNRDKPGLSDPAVPDALADSELAFGDSVPTGTYVDMCSRLPLVDPAGVV